MKSFYFSCLLYDDNKLSNLISYSLQQCRNFLFRQHLPTISFMFWHLREKSDIKTELQLQNRTEHLTGSITLMQRNESKIIWVTQKTERKSKLQTLWNRPDSSWSEPIPGLYRAQIKTTHRVLWDRRAEPLKVQQSCNTCLSLLLSVSPVCLCCLLSFTANETLHHAGHVFLWPRPLLPSGTQDKLGLFGFSCFINWMTWKQKRQPVLTVWQAAVMSADHIQWVKHTTQKLETEKEIFGT